MCVVCEGLEDFVFFFRGIECELGSKIGLDTGDGGALLIQRQGDGKWSCLLLNLEQGVWFVIPLYFNI